MKRVLLVAPVTDLDAVTGEIQEVVNSGLSVKLLRANATEDEISDELLRGEYDVLWFATHAGIVDGRSVIQLAGGATLSEETLCQMVRGTQLQLLYLNTCASFDIAQAIQEETTLTVIATVRDIPDRVAYRTGQIFARRLAMMNDYRGAYEAAKPGRNRVYVYLDNYQKARQMTEEGLRLLREIMEELTRISAYLGLRQRVEADANVSNRYMIVIIIAAALISLSIAFLAFRLAG